MVAAGAASLEQGACLPSPGQILRIHQAPERLARTRDLVAWIQDPPIGHDGEAVGNRFDDPFGKFAVRYGAETLHGCLLETMSRFRPADGISMALAGVDGIDDDDYEPDPQQGLATWLETMKIGVIEIEQERPLFVDVESPELLSALRKHPLVRNALDSSGLGTSQSPVYLDGAIVRLSGPVGRPITQALSAAVHDWYGDLAGIGYPSRLDSRERCYAIFDDRVDVTITSHALSADNPEHRRAVQVVAVLFEIVLPDVWA